MRTLSLIFIFLLSIEAFASPALLRLSGQIAGKSNTEISHELHDLFLAPLESANQAILYSQVSQVSGDGNYFLNLILEPGNDQSRFAAYLAKREGMDFYGKAVHFAKVSRIDERADLQAGLYVDNQQDPFQINAHMERKFSFSSLREWLDFSNGYGYALMKSHAEWMSYLQNFIGDARQFEEFRDQVLSVNNMLAIFPQVSLTLEDGSVTGPDFSETPFLPYRFFRNCYSTRFENGMCSSP